MSNKDQPKTTNPNPSTSGTPTQSNLSSPSVPNQTGKSTKECINEQIRALKDALSIPFLASPPHISCQHHPIRDKTSLFPTTPHFRTISHPHHYGFGHPPAPPTFPFPPTNA
ncbi:hypothetical protein PCASD_10730 [Puccinia coronata f. sp. avenae]|uniref:Uncharacterized protein n=1 Tax=Puccinia coronata f. sp. avenae TaxID=200324 RepID=A0A2N5UPW8_9BASI|nr:hypothetical protein PCASD_10730 [Puccinia coronata f. sp. avenae]